MTRSTARTVASSSGAGSRAAICSSSKSAARPSIAATADAKPAANSGDSRLGNTPDKSHRGSAAAELMLILSFSCPSCRRTVRILPHRGETEKPQRATERRDGAVWHELLRTFVTFVCSVVQPHPLSYKRAGKLTAIRLPRRIGRQRAYAYARHHTSRNTAAHPDRRAGILARSVAHALAYPAPLGAARRALRNRPRRAGRCPWSHRPLRG